MLVKKPQEEASMTGREIQNHRTPKLSNQCVTIVHLLMTLIK